MNRHLSGVDSCCIGNLDVAFYSQILDDMSNGAMVLSGDGKIKYANRAATEFLGLREWYISCVPDENQVSENKKFWGYIREAVNSSESCRFCRVPYYSPERREYHLDMHSSRLSETYASEASDLTSCIVVTMTDVTTADAMQTKRTDALVVLISLLMCVCLWVITVTFFYDYLRHAVSDVLLSRLVEIIAFGAVFVGLKFSSISSQNIGLRSKHLGKDLLEALVICVIMVAALVGGKYLFIRLNIPYFDPSLPFFDWSSYSTYRYAYIGIVLFQEFLARCGMQECIAHILDGKYAGIKSILLSCPLFMVFHFHHGVVYMFGAVIVMAALGFLYNRQRNIWGACLVHYVFGISGMMLHWI